MSWQLFNAKIAASPALQTAIDRLSSPLELITLAKEQGIELTGADLQAIAQNAYQQWIANLEGDGRSFFAQAQADPDLNGKLKQCQTVDDVIGLGKTCGLELSPVELQQAAAAAATIGGFSFEKLWFRKLGLLT